MGFTKFIIITIFITERITCQNIAEHHTNLNKTTMYLGKTLCCREIMKLSAIESDEEEQEANVRYLMPIVEPELTIPQKAERALDLFLESLQNLSEEIAFHFFEFNSRISEFDDHLRVISSLFSQMTFPSRRLQLQLRLAKRLYNIMLEAAGHMMKAASAKDKWYSVISHVYEIRLMSFGLLKKHGTPRIEYPDFNQRVWLLRRKFKEFQDRELRNLDSAPSEVIEILGRQVNRTRRLLLRLQKVTSKSRDRAGREWQQNQRKFDQN